jgi:hypothetical protein
MGALDIEDKVKEALRGHPVDEKGWGEALAVEHPQVFNDGIQISDTLYPTL